MWTWITGEPWSYTNWDVGEPNNIVANENYIVANTTTSKWTDIRDIFSFLPMCEWDSYGASQSAGDQFSPSSNPNGTWSYGYKLTSSSAFQPFDAGSATARGIAGMYGWNASTLASEPHIYFNSTASAIGFAGTVSVPPRSIQMHPGPSGVFAVLRWTAPSAGTYSVSGAFRGNDALNESRIASIQKNGIEIFSGTVGGSGVLNSFNFSNTLSAGDTLDFLVDPNGAHQNDSTGLTLTISNVNAFPLTLGLVGYWNFNDCTANDSSGLSNSGTLVGSPTCEGGSSGSGMRFNSTNYAEIPGSASLDLTSTFTISTWFKADALAPNFPLRLVDKTDAGTNNGYMFPVWSNGMALSAGPTGASATVPISSGVFHHAAVTFNQGIARFFLDGQFVGTGNIGATSVPVNALPLRIGASQGAQANPNANFSGVIDEVRIYNRTLLDVEVAALATAPATVNGTCGTADGVAVATAPTANLCATGTANPTTLTGPGPWSWTCNGSGGGTNSSCSAQLLGPEFIVSMPQMLVNDTGSLIFPSAFIDRPITPLNIICTSSDPLIASVSGSEIYPLWGMVNGNTVTGRSQGTVTLTCNGVSRTVSVIAPPVVTEISYDPVPLGQASRFRVHGIGLLPNMMFRVANCVGDSIEVDRASASSTDRYFRCIPTLESPPMSGLFDIRLRGSNVNLAAAISTRFVPQPQLVPCVEESEEFGRIRRDFGRSGLAGARYGDVDFERWSWTDLTTVSSRLRGASVCHQPNTLDQQVAVNRQLESLRLEMERNLKGVRTKAKAEVFKSGVKIAASEAEFVADFFVVGLVFKSVKAARTLKKASVLFRSIAAVKRYAAPTGQLLQKIDRIERVAKIMTFTSASAVVAADLLSAADIAVMLTDTTDAIAEGYLEPGAERVDSLRTWLAGSPKLEKDAKLALLQYLTVMTARVGAQMTVEHPVAWTSFVANEGWEIASATIGLVPFAGPVFDIWRQAGDGVDNVNKAFDATTDVFEKYNEDADKVLQRALSTKLTDRFLLAEFRATERAKTLVADRQIVDFGATPLGDAKSLPLKLVNRGSLAVEVIALEVDGDEISVTNPTCSSGAVISPGAVCDLSIVMTASAAAQLGFWSNELRLHYRVDGLPYVLRVISRGRVADNAATQTRTAKLSSAYSPGETNLIVGSAVANANTTCVVSRSRLIDVNDPLFFGSNTALKPSGMSYPFGFVDFGLTQCQLGSTVKITVLFPYDLPPPGAIQLWKKTPNGFIRFGQPGAPATFSVNGRQVTYDVVDGGVGDLDGIANGSVVDPVGIGLACNLDLNGDGQVTASADGLLAARYMAGIRGDALTENIALTAAVPNAVAVANRIGTVMQFDVFGRPDLSASLLQDGLVLTRLMQGVSDENLLRGIAVPEISLHVEPSAIRRNVNERCGTNF